MANPQKIRATVKSISDYGRQVYKVDFVTEKRMPRFKAGQFLHLTLDEFDPTTGFWPESRVFSIASCSKDRKSVTIVYSVKGMYTKKMEEALSEGCEVWLKAPYGELVIPNHINDGETAVLIAGGTGISPFIPFLEEVPETVKVQLNYGLRSLDLIIFDDELKQALDNGQVAMNLFLEQPTEGTGFYSGNTVVNEGMLSIEKILSKCPAVETSKFFISGPPTMIELFKQQLINSNISEEKIIIDEWG
jgi:ferredoxin-NADP reductase